MVPMVSSLPMVLISTPEPSPLRRDPALHDGEGHFVEALEEMLGPLFIES